MRLLRLLLLLLQLFLLLAGLRLAVDAVATEENDTQPRPTEVVVGYLTKRIFANTARAGVPIRQGLVEPTTDGAIVWTNDDDDDDDDEEDGGHYNATITRTTACSGDVMGSISFATAGLYLFDCTWNGTQTGWVWIDGHQVCHDNHTFYVQPGSYDNPLVIRNQQQQQHGCHHHSPKAMAFRAHLTSWNCRHARLQIKWRLLPTSNTTNNNATATTKLTPTMPGYEQKREDLQQSLSTLGWGNWLHADATSLVKLPQGLVVELRLCRRDDNNNSNNNNHATTTTTTICTTAVIPDRHVPGTPRVGLHARDGSYVQMYVSSVVNGTTDVTHYVNVSLEYAATASSSSSSSSGDNDKDLDLLVTPVACYNGNASQPSFCDHYSLQLRGRYAWRRAGYVSTNTDGLSFESAGLGRVVLTCSTDSKSATVVSPLSRDTISIPLTRGVSIGCSTRRSTTSEIQQLLRHNLQKEVTRIEATFGTEQAPVATAVQAAIMWSYTYVPVENGPLLPVSRGWNCARPGVHSDWYYCTFEWDNFFASLMAGMIVDKRIAYSNLFQVVKTKTSAGFVPNFAFGGSSSQDRTEPPIGAKVTLELYRKFRDDWVVEVVFDDLLDWNNWILENRILPPANLVALGSWNKQAELNDEGDPGNTMQCARWESGLDNSPMYDGDLFNTSSHLMQLYDIGFGSLFVQEAHALSELATIIGRREESKMLKVRGDIMAAKIAQHLWDPVKEVFVNKFPNNTFYRRISPTSFYALLTGSPTKAQAATMVSKWLLNPNTFCIAPNGDFANNTDDCYWGLPSINRSDPAFPRLGYWRGYIWGPMVQLVYWSLLRYDHVPIVRQGRRALCRQMKELMMSQWNLNRHICENYHPKKSAGDCSGTRFYHWGALAGFVGLTEDSYTRQIESVTVAEK